ncbi:aminoglycoside phosphotransferase family protein [Paenibacillus melissococcoides]|uniref:aminoglycoside phosphotransferase family protein n=1 Tax=Paenibacillus TaxID=44249 RepID=UPI0020C0E2AA|nr:MULTISPECIES: aminoglycoside phosphotransferase family protein [Paenibacillus]CAH8708859.1 aminoglycoside phosphotransferase family protein [Paenibacillus melissococcoides]CAH8709612.1 aminoglycoside phosphotransferase family protein [Paenibacillus melissococcoides]
MSGVIDFTTSYFGDAAADLPKLTALYLERGEEEEAASFLSSYIQKSNHVGDNAPLQEQFRQGLLERFRILRIEPGSDDSPEKRRRMSTVKKKVMRSFYI